LLREVFSQRQRTFAECPELYKRGLDVIHHCGELRLVVNACRFVGLRKVLNSLLPSFVESRNGRKGAGHHSVTEINPIALPNLVTTAGNQLAYQAYARKSSRAGRVELPLRWSFIEPTRFSFEPGAETAYALFYRVIEFLALRLKLVSLP
jgi:hypothetical protein